MAKILSFLIFTVALIWTWKTVNHAHSSQALLTHAQIQSRLTEIIAQKLIEKKPGLKDLKIVRLWTEDVTDTKIRAVFAYAFSQEIAGEGNAKPELTEQSVEGEAFLFKEPGEDKSIQKWVLQSVRTKNESLTFNEGILITPDTKTEGTAEPEAKPTAKPDSHETH